MIHFPVTKIVALRKEYSEISLAPISVDTSEITKEIELKEAQKIQAKETNKIVDAIDSFHHLVIAFLKFRPEFIYKNQATPRTWEYTSFLLNTTFSKSDLVLKELIKGTIGSAIGIEFNAFVDLALKLPSLKAIANSPDTSPIPQEPSTLYAVTTGLLQMMQDKSLQDGIMKYIKRIGREFQFFFFTQARNKYKEIIANKIYIDWANKNTEYAIEYFKNLF